MMRLRSETGWTILTALTTTCTKLRLKTISARRMRLLQRAYTRRAEQPEVNVSNSKMSAIQ